MRLPVKLILILLITTCVSLRSWSQDSVSAVDKIINFPDRFFSRINSKTTSLENSLTKQTEKYMQRLAKKEVRLKRKLSKIDSVAAKNCFADDPAKAYKSLTQKLKSDAGANIQGFQGQYMPYIDSLKGSLTFLKNNPQLLAGSKILPVDVQRSLTQLQQLQGKMQRADEIKEFIQQRKQNIKNYLSRNNQLSAGITKDFNNYSKQGYYYSQQVKEYKETLNDPDKMLKTALVILNKVPAFTGFLKKNSMLASLFNIPGATGNADPGQAVTGLQSRSAVTQAIQNQVGATGPNINALVQQNIQSAQGQINSLRYKLNNLGGGSADLDMPDFKPNNQKTKSFFQRLEYGTNLQSAQSGTFFPTTTDMGLSVGYKLSDKSIIGVGASYKMGWGRDVRHISLSREGVGLRSFLDTKLKGSFYASGGFEYNYQPVSLTAAASVSPGAAEAIPNWTQSGLIGLTKIVSLKSKTFKKTKLQLLWDFLSYRQQPQTQAFKFRVGYNF
jgi:hypothetical protein